MSNCLSEDVLTLVVSQSSLSYLQSLDITKVLRKVLDEVLTLKRDIP